MPDKIPSQIYTMTSQPGVRRDGTDLDSPFYSDVQWCRFQRGRPRKMGGYRAISDQLTGPIAATYLDSRASGTTIHSFSQWGIERLQVDSTGVGGSISNRTPITFTPNPLFTWTTGAMFSSTGGSFAALIAAATPDGADISSDVGDGIYAGDLSGTGPFTQISDSNGPISVSGGCCVLQPFLFVYGSNGLIRNSNPNDFSTATGWTTGGSNLANSVNVSGSKIVKGLPMRGGVGASPAGLFWSLDSLIRVTLGNATTLFNYDTVSSSISILAKNSVIEYDGLYFWIGIDRFFVYNGVVNELPNAMNINYFFDNLNFAQRQKVFAVKVPRYGEIWWFYPKGTSTQCNNVIIYNVREQIWYDNICGRSGGSTANVFQYPVMGGVEDSRTVMQFTFVQITGTFKVGDTITGTPSLASGQIAKIVGSSMSVTTTSVPFLAGDSITAASGATGSISTIPVSQQLDVMWQHEFGKDKIHGQNTNAILSSFTTSNFSFMTGGPLDGQGSGPNIQSRIVRVEPDFIQNGPMNVFVAGTAYANSPIVTSPPYLFTNQTEHIDLREMRRIVYMRFESNVISGDYQMGKNFLTVEVGDERG